MSLDHADINVSCMVLQVQQKLFEEGFMADVDLSHGDTLNKKIRNAQLAQYNYILGTHARDMHVTMCSVM